jgi:hypothetical protein
MAAKKAAGKGGTSKGTGKAKKQPRKLTKGSVNDGDELAGAGLSLADLARLNGKYEKFESLEERVKEVERVKRAIFANLMRTALGMMKQAEKGSNAAGAKLLWDFAEIDQLPKSCGEPAETAQASEIAGNARAAGQAEDDDDPTTAVLAFYKKLGMTPPKLKPAKAETGKEAATAVV